MLIANDIILPLVNQQIPFECRLIVTCGYSGFEKGMCGLDIKEGASMLKGVLNGLDVVWQAAPASIHHKSHAIAPRAT